MCWVMLKKQTTIKHKQYCSKFKKRLKTVDIKKKKLLEKAQYTVGIFLQCLKYTKLSLLNSIPRTLSFHSLSQFYIQTMDNRIYITLNSNCFGVKSWEIGVWSGNSDFVLSITKFLIIMNMFNFYETVVFKMLLLLKNNNKGWEWNDQLE